MAKTTSKPKPKVKPKAKNKIKKTSGAGWAWKLVLVLAVAAALYFLRNPITEAILEAVGFGAIIIALWILVIIGVIWRRQHQQLKEYWNSWLAALVLSVAGMGILALFKPDITISEVELAEATLAGSAGQTIAGNSLTWLRLTVLVLLGIVIAGPKFSYEFSQEVLLSIWNGIVLAASAIGRLSKKTGPKIRLVGAWLIGPPRQKPIRIKPSKKVKLKEVAEPVEKPTEPSEITEETKDDSSAEQMIMPGIDSDLPPIELLTEAPKADFAQADDDERARLIEDALGSYGVEVNVTQINPGPSVTQFGVEPGWARKFKKIPMKDQDGKPVLDKEGYPKYHLEETSKTRIKVEKVTSLANDLALALAVSDIRIEAPIPGKAMIGIEVPNTSTAVVSLRGVLESPQYKKLATKTKLATALGLGSGGEAVAGDIAKMPHVLIAGATGSGKSVCLNCIVCCILAQTSPHDVRVVLIDPKRVEMVTFSEIPHLISPVVVDSEKAVDTLRKVTLEMDNRYRKFAEIGVRNIEAYNKHPKRTEKMPYLVVIIDELADLMMTTPDVVEPLLCRLAQLARATGIHLVVATQRPSVDVITGLIKANFPSRISFAVVSSIDSRTILDTIGAEKLLGKGDMLYIPPEANKPKRIRGCFVSDEEIESLVGFWKNWAVKNFPPESDRIAQEFESLIVQPTDADPFMEKARQICEESASISISLLQRKLHIGYQRAARLMEQLQEEGALDDELADAWEGEL